MTALRLRSVRKRFGRRVALDGFDLDLPRGSVTGLVGSNGAGKTTAMAVALGFVRADDGTVDLFGEGPFDARRHSGRVGILPQDAALPPDATPRSWLTGLARLQGLDGAAAGRAADGWLADLHLSDRAGSPMRTLSHGMRKRVMVAQALLGTPELVLLDEPLSGVDPREADVLRRLLADRRAAHTAVLISSHDLSEIERGCDAVIMVERGKAKPAVAVAELSTAHRGRIVYRLAGPPPAPVLEALQSIAAFDWNAQTGTLSGTLTAGASADLAAVNAAVLRALLDAGVGVLAVDPGSRIEAAFLRDA